MKKTTKKFINIKIKIKIKKKLIIFSLRLCEGSL